MPLKTEGSPPRSLKSKADMLALAEGLGIALASAGLTYITNALPDVDLGATWSPLVMGLWAVASKAALQWLSDTQKTIQE